MQLKNRQIDGLKFRRQHGLGRYIADFYCPEIRVVIELDGGSHESEEAQKYDAERTRYIESLGIKVIRFPDGAVLNDIEYVLREIRRIIRS